MKTNFKIKLYFLLISLSFLFSRCSTEESIIKNEVKPTTFDVKKIYRDEIDTNVKILQKLEKLSPQKNSISAKNVPVNELGLIIQTDCAKYIENGNYHSYTFPTVQKEQENIKNVFFSLNNDGDYDAYLIEYPFNKLQLNTFTEQNKPGEAIITPIKLDLKTLTSKNSTVYACAYNYILVDTGDLVGAGNERYEWVLQSASCQYYTSSTPVEDHATNYSNGTSATYTTYSSGGGATSPIEYDPWQAIINAVRTALNTGGQQNRYLDVRDDIASDLYDMLARNKFSEESKAFGKELLNLIMSDPESDLNAFKFVINAQINNKINNNLDETFLLAMDQYMDADLTDIQSKDPDLIIYFGAHHITKMLRLKKLNPQWSFLKCYWEASKEVVHITLDVFGMVPVAGELADITNGALYVIEGDGINASLSLASAVPIAGWASVTTKYAIKINEVYSIGTKVKLVWKVSGDLITFGSRNQLRKVLGLVVGDLRQAHHIIPWNKQSKLAIQKASKSKNAFHMNEALNGIPLSNAIHSGSHANYDNLIQGYLDDIPSNATPDQAYEKVMEIIVKVRTAIQNNPSVPLNQLIF